VWLWLCSIQCSITIDNFCISSIRFFLRSSFLFLADPNLVSFWFYLYCASDINYFLPNPLWCLSAPWSLPDLNLINHFLKSV
jgi:hypothetical protein